MNRLSRIVVAIYVDADFYPPTINAILNFAENAEEVVVICRNNTKENFNYPFNVKMVKIGDPITVREMETESLKEKFFSFMKFCNVLRKYAKHSATNLVVLYDPFSLLAFYLIKPTISKRKIWYHNHDMPNKESVKRYSLGRFSANVEHKAMNLIDFFSLPDLERKKYYIEFQKQKEIFIIPNYPSLKVYGNQFLPKIPVDKIRIIYQGFVGKGHGLETLLELLGNKIGGYNLELICKGSVTEQYKIALIEKATKLGVTDKLIFLGIGPYKNLMNITAGCHIGIGINTNTDKVSLAQGTASNKIYEYTAIGLPVIINNSPQFLRQLSNKEWVFFADDNIASIKDAIESIIYKWSYYSIQARRAFEKELNFENYFAPVLQRVISCTK